MDKIKNSKFKYKIPMLKNITFEINDEYNNEENIEDVIVYGDKKIQRNDNDAVVSLELNIYEKDNVAYPFFLSISMEGKFAWDEDINEEMVDVLLNENAPSVLVSFIRPYVMTLTAGAGFDSFILPLFDFTSN